MNNTESPQPTIIYIIKSYTEAQRRACKKYYDANREKVVQRQVERARERYKTDQEFREKQCKRVREVQKRKKLLQAEASQAEIPEKI
jgi:hypothetical protein